jgi:hypothetical protein
MLCLFEFVSVAGDDQSSPFGGVTLRATSVADAERMARGMLASSAFRRRWPDACLIKDETGRVLGRVWGRAGIGLACAAHAAPVSAPPPVGDKRMLVN